MTRLIESALIPGRKKKWTVSVMYHDRGESTTPYLCQAVSADYLSPLTHSCLFYLNAKDMALLAKKKST